MGKSGPSDCDGNGVGIFASATGGAPQAEALISPSATGDEGWEDGILQNPPHGRFTEKIGFSDKEMSCEHADLVAGQRRRENPPGERFGVKEGEFASG
jgi:hypothetical protein